jgi:hypothetical protein
MVAQGKLFPTLKEFLSILFTFSLTVLAWIFFRSYTVEQAFMYISKIFSVSFFSVPLVKIDMYDSYIYALIVLFIIIEWLGREQKYALAQIMPNKPKVYRWAFYYLLIVIIFIFAGSNQEFIYFQF